LKIPCELFISHLQRHALLKPEIKALLSLIGSYCSHISKSCMFIPNTAIMNSDLLAYYKERAKEYEDIYQKPERQDDLRSAKALLQALVKDKAVIEIACGTGYWTEQIARAAASVFATDINETVIDIARQKGMPAGKVSFSVADVYALPQGNKYNCVFGGFIWSHIPMQQLDRFIGTVNKTVAPGSTVIFMDNNYVPGSSTPVSDTDEHGNTFQLRQLKDGTKHRVLKNFPAADFLREKLSGIADDIDIVNLEYFWILSYRTG